MSLSILPLELLDNIVEELFDLDPDNLLSLCLVSEVFRVLCQKRLFKALAFESNDAPQRGVLHDPTTPSADLVRLCSILAANPALATHVQQIEFSLFEDPPPVLEDDVPSVDSYTCRHWLSKNVQIITDILDFLAFSPVRVFYWDSTSSDPFTWGELDDQLKSRISHILGSRCLESILLYGIEAPIDLLFCCNSLTSAYIGPIFMQRKSDPSDLLVRRRVDPHQISDMTLILLFSSVSDNSRLCSLIGPDVGLDVSSLQQLGIECNLQDFYHLFQLHLLKLPHLKILEITVSIEPVLEVKSHALLTPLNLNALTNLSRLIIDLTWNEERDAAGDVFILIGATIFSVPKSLQLLALRLRFVDQDDTWEDCSFCPSLTKTLSALHNLSPVLRHVYLTFGLLNPIPDPSALEDDLRQRIRWDGSESVLIITVGEDDLVGCDPMND